MIDRVLNTSDDYGMTVARMILGVVFVVHGAQKVFGWWGGAGFAGTMGMFGHMGIPTPLAFLAIMAEFLGGLGLIVGALSRVAAFGIITNMVVAIATVHWSNGFFMNWAGTQKGEGFEYHLLAIALALAVLINGAGAVSVDRAYTTKNGGAGG